MASSPCFDESGLKTSPWTPEEDQKLADYIHGNGPGSWRALPKLAGLKRCGKSCRLRWMNYLRPDIKRGKFSEKEEQIIINLQQVLGNKWSAIACHLPGRTDNEIKNFWNTHLRKKLLHKIDPVGSRTCHPRSVGFEIDKILEVAEISDGVMQFAVHVLPTKIDAPFFGHNNEPIFTTNHRDQHDVVSLPPAGMDIYIHTSSPQPIALPDGGKRTYHNSLLLSNSEKENMREAYDSTKRYLLPNFDATENKAVKVYIRQGREFSLSMELKEPPTFADLGKDPENEGIISDLLNFVRDKDLYKRIGKKWKRGYLLHDSPGIDRSSLIVAMAKCLEFDIYELDLTVLTSIWELKRVMDYNRNRSLIAIKDFDHWFGMHPNLKNEVFSLSHENELTLSGLFEVIEGLVSRCGDRQIIVLTTNHNHRDRFHTALKCPLNIDAYKHTSSPQPIALPDGGEIVELDLEQKPGVDFDATNIRAYQSSVLVSNSEKENRRETLKSWCMTESELSSDDSTTGISLTDFDYRADLVRAYQSGPIIFTSENEDMREGLNGECLTKSVLSDEFVDGLSSSCGNERIIVSTTDHRDRHDAALLPMDTYIHKASPQPIGLPDGGEIVQLQSIGQKSLVDTYIHKASPQPIDQHDAALLPMDTHFSGSINPTVPACSGPSLSQQPMPTTPYTMHRILHMMCPPTSSPDASSVKLKATYRDTIIEFHLPLTSGIIELKEEVAKILKLELDSFDVKYKAGEGEGDGILIPCGKDFRNYLQLFSSLVNPVVRLLVVDKDANLTNMDPMALKQLTTLVESGIDPDSNGIISDLLRFVSKKEICKKAGKAWTRFYLLYEPPGADRSSLIADMANYLEFDICYLDIRSMSSILELKNMLLSTPNRSLIAIQDIDHCAGMLPNLKNELTVSCLLKYVDGLFLRCGDERIIVLTTNHRDQNDAALLPLVNTDIYIPASSPQPIALQDDGEIVRLESSEQKPSVDFDATNNRECHSGILVSSSKNNNKREASKRLCMTDSVLTLVHPTTGISLTEFDAPNNGAHLVRACQGGPIMSNLERKDTGEGLKGDFLTKSVFSLDDSTKQKSLPDCDATESEAHLLIAYQSCPDVSLLQNSLENRNRGEALKRECITKSILGLEDLQQHSGGRRDNAAKSFAAIYDSGIHTTNSLARKSFEVVETLRSSEQPSNATDTEQEREIWTQMCLEQSDACGAHSVHVNTYARRFWAHLFLSLCHSVCVRNIFWEPDDFLPSLSLRRLTLKGCVQKQKSPYLARLLQIIAVEPGLTKSPRYLGGSFAKSGTPLHWSDVLPDGGQVISLSEKEIVRKTLKRKCRTTKVRRLEYHQLHFDSRCQDAAKRHGAKRICRQHVINQKWAMMKVYSLEGQRPLEVISPSTGRKLVSRLQVIHVSWLGRSSPGSSAIPGGGEIVGFIGLSSSGFAATNNRANLLGQNPSGSTASHSNKKRRRDAAVDKGTNLYISEQDLRQHLGLTREEAARLLGVSVTTFKRHCRKHGILRWPCYRNRSSDIPGRPPDPDERNTYPTCKASIHEQTEMVDHLRNPNEVAPDLLDGIGAFLETPTSPAACAGNNVDMEVFVSSFLEEEMEAIGSYGAAFQPQEQTTVSIAYPTHNYPVCAQPHIAAKEMISENMRSSNLTSQVEARLEWYGSRSSYLAVPTCSNLASSQPMSTIPETRPTIPQSMSTIPETGPTVSQPMSTISEIGPTVPQPMSINPRPTVPQPMSTLPDTGPTIMTIKAKYRDSTIKFKLPLTSTLAELNEKVEMRLNLKPGSFDVEYKDEDQDDWNEGWITIACDEDLRDYLQLFSSLDNPVIKLLVLDKVVNANESSGSLKRKRL